MTGRRSHWTERGDDDIFLRLAIVVRLFLLWQVRMGLLSWDPLQVLCKFSIPKCGGVLGGNDQNRAEKQNVVFIPTSDLVVRSSWSPNHSDSCNSLFIVVGAGLVRCHDGRFLDLAFKTSSLDLTCPRLLNRTCSAATLEEKRKQHILQDEHVIGTFCVVLNPWLHSGTITIIMPTDFFFVIMDEFCAI